MTMRFEFAKLSVALLLMQCMPLNAMAQKISSSSLDSNFSFSAPMYAKLDNSTGDSGDDKKSDVDLGPVKLERNPEKDSQTDNAKDSNEQADSGDSGTLNAKIEKENFVPKPPVERTDSVVGNDSKVSAKGKKKPARAEINEKILRETANRVGPTELQATDKEMHNKAVTIIDAERAELADIWDAALCRSQDIQFVVQKLMPTKDPKHSTAVMMKMLSTAMYGSVAAGSIMGGSFGGTGGAMIQSAGASLIMNVLNQVNSHTQKKLAGNETEVIMLYKMIRDVGREVAQDFHAYKKHVHQVSRACADYADLQDMVTQARSGQDGATQLHMEFLLRDTRREIDALNEDARHSRESLVSLAGPEAIDKLDEQINAESEKIGHPLMPKGGVPKGESSVTP